MMTKAETLAALGERVALAKGPDRELDALICRVHLDRNFGSEYDVPDNPPAYTASIDAAKSLKHPADLWCVGSMEDGPFARVVPAIPGGVYGDEITAHAETVENALTAAFLRATAVRQALAQETGK